MTVKELKAAHSEKAPPYIRSRELIAQVIKEMTELETDELYKAGRFDGRENKDRICDICELDSKKINTLGQLISGVLDFGAFIETIDDDATQAAIERGDFVYDEDEEFHLGSPAYEYETACTWAFNEALHLISYIHYGFCIDTLKGGEANE